jgi:hypothetical protein
MRAIDLIITCSKKGAVAARDQWHSARKQGLLDPKDFSRRDVLDLQVLSAIFMKIQGTLTLEALDKCVEFVERADIPPETQVVYLGFLIDLAAEARVGDFRVNREVRADGFDWKVADALSNISPGFDRRVAIIRNAAKRPPLN